MWEALNKPLSSKSFGIILLVVMLLMLSACKESSLDNKTGRLKQGQPDEISLGVKLKEYKGDQLDYTIEAERIERFTGRRLLYAYKVLLTTYDDKGLPSSSIKADSTLVDDARNLIYAMGNVFIDSPEASVSTQKMILDRNIDEITVPTPLVLVRNGDVLRGNTLRTNTSLSFAEMDKVSAEGYFDEKDFTW